MSKTKTKRARRELKREGNRKIAAHHRKIAKAAETTAKSTTSTSSSTKPSSAKKHKTTTNKTTTTEASQTTPKPPPVQASQKHAIPFGPYDHILLVGEGDFSFARSLAVEHGCANVTATSYDATEEEVAAKYPRFETISAELRSLVPPVPLHFGVDAGRLGGYKTLRCVRDDDDDDEGDTHNDDEASKRNKTHGWDTICFMFPHTGGLSTDVNRQVRANQALLVAFFKSCLDTPTPAKRLRILQAQAQAQNNNTTTTTKPPFLRMSGRIIVTLFEGEPYTLWNIRDLARHAGLKVVESWKFDWEQYPGYAHVRTLGAVENGWKGEDRNARMYVFEKIPLVADSDEEVEMKKLARNARGGALGSQKKGFAAAASNDKKRGREGSASDGD